MRCPHFEGCPLIHRKGAIPSFGGKDLKMHFKECKLVWFELCIVLCTSGVFHLKPSFHKLRQKFFRGSNCSHECMISWLYF